MKIYIVDAFTNKPFKGNPAAVCLLNSVKPDDWMQQIASEMNLSETAFLVKNKDNYNLRWFTPVSEVDLCGHATLASAHILWFEEGYSGDKIFFSTKSGLITVEKNESLIHMNFPLEVASITDAPTELIQGLGISSYSYVGKNRFDYIVEVDSQSVIQTLKPDFSTLMLVKCRGVVVTSRSDDSKYDFVSRCFFPSLGVNEDPVTGSAHCLLGPYWMERMGKNELKAKQISSRSGELLLKILDNRIIISGEAVTTMIGELKA